MLGAGRRKIAPHLAPPDVAVVILDANENGRPIHIRPNEVMTGVVNG